MDNCRERNVADIAEACRLNSSIWRGAPFWALNGELDPEEICRQIRSFARCGLGIFSPCPDGIADTVPVGKVF